MGKPQSKVQETIVVNQAAAPGSSATVDNHPAWQEWHTVRAEAAFALAILAVAGAVGFLIYRQCRKKMHRYVQASVAEHLDKMERQT